MYVEPNYRTKKALKDAVKNGEAVSVFIPNGGMFGPDPTNGQFSVEGPHYPKPHTWYARVTVVNGKVTKVS